VSEAYSALARWYDVLGDTVDYEGWADKLTSLFPEGASLLDIGCGTGNMTLPLARRGYDMIGVDLSCDMLAVAREKAMEAGLDILFLQQNMTCLDLYGTVDGVICALDGINYLLSEDELYACFSSVYKFLNPDGRFVFDVNTPYKFRHIYGDNHYILEDEGVYLGWRNEYDEESGICDFYLDMFSEGEDGSYERTCEDQSERCYCADTLIKIAQDCGFKVEGYYSTPDRKEPREDDDRWYFVLKKEI